MAWYRLVIRWYEALQNGAIAAVLGVALAGIGLVAIATLLYLFLPPRVASVINLVIVGILLLIGVSFFMFSTFGYLRFDRSMRRRVRGLCPNCGYDWHVTPGRCPECGNGAV